MNERMIKLEQELEEEKTKVKLIEQEKKTMQNEHHDTLENLDEGVNTMIDTNSDLLQKIHDITDQRDKFKDKAERIERNHEYDWLKNLLRYALSFTGGAVFDRTILPEIKEFLLSLIAKYEKTPWDPANATQPLVVIQPNIHYTHTGVTQVTIISGTTYS